MGRLTKGVLALAAAASTAVVTGQPVHASQASDGRPVLPDTTDEAFNEECLAAHNSYRARHGAPPLVLDDAAIAHAVRRARDASAQEGRTPSPGTRGYGENRFWFATYEDEPASCEEAVRLWYEARWTGGYDWDRPGYSPDTGSFTQVVWKSTSVLGCGRAAGRPAGGEAYETYIVCGYGPAGNVIGKFRANVGEPVGE
ncbi:CAP family protein [Streptomyces sp. SCL15-4]|uniref:CAP family protein n=1 Tax=Streptomyces sp. SCL15-4 TaxID=2967221 RepID=UPI002966F297|nr:CAP family protein [Streptomyces sp. SCL15-4]